MPYDSPPPNEMKMKAPTLKLLYINQFKEETLISMTIKKNKTLSILEKTLLKLGGKRSTNISIV